MECEGFSASSSSLELQRILLRSRCRRVPTLPWHETSTDVARIYAAKESKVVLQQIPKEMLSSQMDDSLQINHWKLKIDRYVNSFPCFLLHIQTLSPHGSHQNQRGLHFDRKFLQVLSHCRRKSFSLRSLKILRQENPTWPGWSSKVPNDTPAFFIFQRDNHLKLNLSLVRVFFVSSFQMLLLLHGYITQHLPKGGWVTTCQWWTLETDSTWKSTAGPEELSSDSPSPKVCSQSTLTNTLDSNGCRSQKSRLSTTQFSLSKHCANERIRKL